MSSFSNGLRAATFIRHVEVHDALGSTNDRALELAREASIELPALIVARRQTAGRGRGINKWWTADGALTFSLLIDAGRLGIQPAQWPQLSLATAVAIGDALELRIADCGLRIRDNNPKSEISNPKSILSIKWPNDVLVNGRKISGILIESPGVPPPAKDRLIIGIGVNVNNSWHKAPQDINQRGTSLMDITGGLTDLQSFLIDLLNHMKVRLEQVRISDAKLKDAWQRLDFLAGKAVTVEVDGHRIQGQCVEIAYDGALVLETTAGHKRFFNGTVRVVEDSAL